MGFLGSIAASVAGIVADTSTAVVVAAGVAAVAVLVVVLNVLQQLLFKNPSEPPVVFHWVPFVGSTITYGIDPYKFFFRCREKVRVTFLFVACSVV
jgi:predicted tellurium resistance membrane protein TerC